VFQVESPASGILAEILVEEGKTVSMTEQLGIVQPIGD
jgi:pyruvate/2-oxoglutarate dehydrogenase complex dihydrolipoamide acyltransferase (E2) component